MFSFFKISLFKINLRDPTVVNQDHLQRVESNLKELDQVHVGVLADKHKGSEQLLHVDHDEVGGAESANLSN